MSWASCCGACGEIELFGGAERLFALNHRELALDIFPFISWPSFGIAVG